jgi:hypothetical protein
MSWPCPPPPAPGQLERAAQAAAAEEDRALASPVIRLSLYCVPYDPAGTPLWPERSKQSLSVHVHAARTLNWFWMRIQQHLSRIRGGHPVFPNQFVDPGLSQVTINLTDSDKPSPAEAPNVPPHPPPPPCHPNSREQWWTVHALHVCPAHCHEPLPMPHPPPEHSPPLQPASTTSEPWWARAALRLDSGYARDFDGRLTLADAGVVDGCVLSLAVRQHEGVLPPC